MSSALKPIQPWPKARIVRPFGYLRRGLRLSQRARQMQCIGGVVFGSGVINERFIGNPAQLAGGTNKPTISMTEEGPALHFVTASQQFSNATVRFPTSDTIDQMSIVARLRPTTAASGPCYAVYWGNSTPNRAIGVGSDASAHAVAHVFTGSGFASTAGTNTFNGAYVTVGVSSSAVFLNVFENGVGANTLAIGGGLTVASMNFIQFGIRPGGYSPVYYDGDVAWAFFFNKQLSSLEHFLVAKYPWLLLELSTPLAVVAQIPPLLWARSIM